MSTSCEEAWCRGNEHGQQSQGEMHKEKCQAKKKEKERESERKRSRRTEKIIRLDNATAWQNDGDASSAANRAAECDEKSSAEILSARLRRVRYAGIANSSDDAPRLIHAANARDAAVLTKMLAARKT